MQGKDSLSHLFALCKGGSRWFLSGSFGACVQGFMGTHGVVEAVFILTCFSVSRIFIYHLSSSARSSVNHRVSWGVNNAKLLTRGAACSCEVSHGAGLGVCSPQLPSPTTSPGLLPAPSPTLEPSAGGSGCVSSIWI